MKILVTGAEGFIGSHLVERLVKSNHKVKAFVLYNSFNSLGWLDTLDKKIKKKIDFIVGDIRDENSMKESIKGCDVVINLAALIGIPYSYKSPRSYYDTNVIGTLNILQASKDLKVKKIIHTSTSEVYGTPIYTPIDERHPINSQSPYASSKVAADQLAISFYKSYNLPVTILRPFNTYGPRQSARAVIPTIITQILSGKKFVKLGNIETTRDLTYIDDTISGFINSITRKNDGEEINLGTGFDYSIKYLVNIISKILSVDVKIILDKKRVRPKKSEVLKLQSKNLKARKLLNWKPKYINKNGLALGLKRTIEWFANSENIKNYKSDKYNI